MLFVERGDLNSEVAIDNLSLALNDTDYRCWTAVLEGRYHQAVCISYKITSFPTMLVLDEHASALHRETKVRNMHWERIAEILSAIDHHRNYPQ